MSELRIRQELDKIKTTSLLANIGASAGPVKKTNIFEWNAILTGPKKTPYENNIYKLSIKFPQDFPRSPPSIKFITKIFHPNVSTKGDVCVSSIGSLWNENNDIITILYSIFKMLKTPNLEHGINEEAINLCKNDINSFNLKVKEYNELYSIKKI